MSDIATHEAPVWGPQADFVVRADLSGNDMPGRLEQLWARKETDTVFAICCIPFFAYGIALGDKVETDTEYTIKRVVEKSGHKTIRIAVVNEQKVDSLHRLIHEWVIGTNLRYEWYSQGYLSVDVPADGAGPDMAAVNELTEAGEVCWEFDE